MKHCPFPTWLSEEFSKTLNFIHNINWQKTNPPAFETVVLGGVWWYYITSRGHVGCHQGRVPSFLSASPVGQWMLGHRGPKVPGPRVAPSPHTSLLFMALVVSRGPACGLLGMMSCELLSGATAGTAPRSSTALRISFQGDMTWLCSSVTGRL